MNRLVIAALIVLVSCGGGESPAIVTPPPPPPPKPATLVIDVRGLPGSLAPVVDVLGAGVTRRVPVSDTLAGLSAGSYTVTVSPVENTDARFGPLVATYQLTLAAGETQSVRIDYAELTGRLAIGIDGMPSGTPASIDVAGPASFAVHLTQADTLRKLAPGTYTVSAASTAGTSHYAPDSVSRTIRVDSARTASLVVQFKPLTSLAIQIDGLPVGLSPSVDVAGPSFARHLTASGSLNDLPIATYTVTPQVVSIGADTYRAAPQSVTLIFAGPNTVSIQYVRQLGRITFQIQGGPTALGNPTSPILVLTGPAGTASFSRDTTMTGLPFGTYRYTVRAPVYDVPFGTSHATRGAVYQSSLEGRADLSVTLDTLHTSSSVTIPLTLVSGSLTFETPGARNFPGGTTIGNTVYDARGNIVVLMSRGDIRFNIPAGTYTAKPGIQSYFDDWDWPSTFSTTTTVTAASPIGAISIPFHPLVWPSVNFAYTGMPAGQQVGFQLIATGMFQSNSIVFAPSTLPHGYSLLPGSYHVQVLAPTVARDSSAAWTAPTKAFDYSVQEGQTATITIPMVPTNILQLVATGPMFGPSSVFTTGGVMTVTYPDGHTVDFRDFSNQNGTVMIADQPAGNYVIKANTTTFGATTYVPNLSTQTVSLPVSGRVVVNITYTVR